MGTDRKPTLGLIVNPVAGLGGRVGLKGSDGTAIQERAIALGAVSEAHRRTGAALERLVARAEGYEIVCAPAEMGEAAAAAVGLTPVVIGSVTRGRTTAADTRAAAAGMMRLGVTLLLFAGGDGTARDIADVVGHDLLVLGIPTGVKMQSGVFAVSPVAAGEVAAVTLRGGAEGWREAEVMDIDEDALREGIVASRLYGTLRAPLEPRLVQGAKCGSRPSDAAAAAGIAEEVARRMEDETLSIVGPGTTTRAILARLGLEKTLLGVDVVRRGEVVARDVNEERLLELIKERPARIVVTPIGGQGCLFGRGNQQISPEVIARVGRDNLLVAATPGKLAALEGRSLWVDTGDPDVDRMLIGYIRVVTGIGVSRICRVSTGSEQAA